MCVHILFIINTVFLPISLNEKSIASFEKSFRAAKRSGKLDITYEHRQENINIFRKALLKRALEDIPVLRKLETDWPSFVRSFSHNWIPPNVMSELKKLQLHAKKEIERVRAVANMLQPNWGQIIFNQAAHIFHNEVILITFEYMSTHVYEIKMYVDLTICAKLYIM